MLSFVAHTARENADGTWNVEYVPIFGEIPKGERGNDVPVDKKWHEAAVAKLKQRDEEGYLPPLHLRHHDWNGTARPAGQFRVREVADATYEGATMSTIFADLVNVPADVKGAIDRGEWPYRSVEIHSYGQHEIGSLALLDSEAPFFKFPMLRIGESIHHEAKADVVTTPDASPISFRGSIRVADAAAALFRFGDPVAKLADEPTAKPAEKPEGEPKPEAKVEGDEEPEGDEKSLAAAVREMTAKLDTLITLLSPSTKTGEPAAKPPVEAGTDAGAKMAALSGENAALQAAARLREKQDAEKALVDAAVAKLAGWPVDDVTKADLARLAADSGAKGLDAFVESYRRNTPKDPPRIHPDIAGADTVPVGDVPEVAAFAARGPEALAAARAAYPRFAPAKASGMQSSLTTFLSNEVARALAR